MTTPQPRTALRVAAYYCAACALSWLAWLPLLNGPASPYWHLWGSLGPALAGLATTAILAGREGLSELAGRVLRWSVPSRWHVIALAAPFAIYLAAAAAAAAIGESPRLGELGTSAEYGQLPRPAYWLAVLVFYGFGEEIGWRGTLLPLLLRRMSPRRATFVLSLFWAFWHLPLFWFSPGLSSLDPPGLAGWYASLLTGAALLTWFALRTGYSIPVAAAFHAAMDIAFLSPATPSMTGTIGAIVTVWGLVIWIVALRPARGGT